MAVFSRIIQSLGAPCTATASANDAPPHAPAGLPARAPDLSLLALFGSATLLIGVLVLAGNMMLSPMDGQGVLEFVEDSAAAEAIRASWAQHGLLSWAKRLFLLDSLWVLAYAPFLALLIVRLSGEIRADFPPERRLPALCWIYLLGLLAVVLLAAADLIENSAAIGIIEDKPSGIALIPASWMVPAAMLKKSLLTVSLGLVAALLLTWFFNLFNPAARRNVAAEARARQRVLLRVGIADIVWRSRYVLVALVIYGFLTLLMDQSRDVLVGMAQGVDQPELRVLVLVGILVSALGVWVFAYACWLWTRVMARMLRPDDEVLAVEPGSVAERPADGRDLFAKWWARLLGTAPFLMLAWLCGLASRDAVRAGVPGTPEVLFWFGTIAMLLAACVLGARAIDKGRVRHARPASGGPSADTGKQRYYDVIGPREAPCELSGPRYRFLFAIPHAPLFLPILALALFQLVRAVDLSLDGGIPLTLAAIALALALWTSLLGLVAQAALRQAVPWVLFLMLAIGVLGLFGWTDNHRLWPIASGATGMGTLWAMWGFQALLGAVVIGALLWTYFRIAASHDIAGGLCQYRFDWPRTWYGGRLAAGLVLSLAAALVLLGADRLMFETGSGEHGQPAGASISDRKALDDAIADWVSGLKADWEQQNESGASPAEIPVYFVSAQGGGIRSAYWTALVLDRLAGLDPAFERRTFSISGVSGGSVGAAVWSVCEPGSRGGARDRNDCIEGLGQANLLTPLMSAWLFEDVLARFIPSSWCRLPGCGIMSRGSWFERSLEQDVNGLAAPMTGPVTPGAHGPYLFLNSTWVENGERAIASRLRIEPASFPAAGDQLARIGRDLLLSTAAHNSARFTYINAIGNADGKGHLADGGYFDNSGGHTTDDILRAFRRCLFNADDPCKLNDRRADLQTWAQEHLVPQAIQIRNGIDAADPTDKPAPADLCPDDFTKPIKGLAFYSDLLGPAFAAFNAIGTGSNGRVAEAKICKSVEAWRRLRGAKHREASAATTLAPVRRIDLTNENVLYPLGWYLSPTARDGMEDAALRVEPATALSAE